MDVFSIFTFIYDKIASIFNRNRKKKISDDSVNIESILTFNLEDFKINRIRHPYYDYSKASESFDSLHRKLHNKNLNKELELLKSDLKKIASLAKETTDDLKIPESEYYIDYCIFGFDKKPLIPRFRNVDKELEGLNEGFANFRMNSKKYVNRLNWL